MNGEAACAFHPSACLPTDVGRDGSVRLTERNRQALSKLPIWAFVAADDEAVDPASTADCISRLHAVNPVARMTDFEDAGHRDVPTLAWLDEELGLLSWMLAQQRLICRRLHPDANDQQEKRNRGIDPMKRLEKHAAGNRIIRKGAILLLAGILSLQAIGALADTYIRLGSSGSEVSDLQTALKALGCYAGDITGHAGEKTVAAIKAFQSKYGLTADGIAGPDTLQKIQTVYAGSSASPASWVSTDTVKEVQTMLKAIGLYAGEITGSIGTKTDAAIRSFQKKYGLTVDGIPGAQTVSKLTSVYLQSGTSTSSGVNLSVQTVRSAQTMLKALGFYSGDITGSIGTKTDAAIRSFQSKYGLTVDGIPGAQTMAKLSALYDGTGTLSSASLQLGATGSAVSALQENLSILGYYYGDVTGHYGTLTKAAVLAFQKAKGLTADGIAGTRTLSAIDYALGSASGSSSGTSVSGSSSFGLGDTSATILWMQELLKELGYYSAECTGHFGSKTQAAVKLFQAAHGLTADGIVGSKTMAALQAADKGNDSAAPDFASSVLDLHWFNEKSYYLSHGISTGSTITITDVVTGKSFNGRIQSTGNHADVEPKTSEDTKTMCAIWGVSDAKSIDYTRKAILVTATVSGTTYTYAASMYGEVHGSQTIYDNDYEGQFCVHFRHSTTSETEMEYADNQEPIDAAVNYATQKLDMTHITDSSQIQ